MVQLRERIGAGPLQLFRPNSHTSNIFAHGFNHCELVIRGKTKDSTSFLKGGLAADIHGPIATPQPQVIVGGVINADGPRVDVASPTVHKSRSHFIFAKRLPIGYVMRFISSDKAGLHITHNLAVIRRCEVVESLVINARSWIPAGEIG
jgi:hypothetical protein